MNAQEFKTEIISRCVKLNGISENWITHNSKIHAKLVKDDLPSYDFFKLDLDEKPVFESHLPNGNYLLLTTKKGFSIIDGLSKTVLLQDIEDIDVDCVDEISINEKKRTSKICFLIFDSTENFIYEVDSYFPAHVSINLIRNISSYLKWNRWL
ncbi:MAG: hypothetical protein O9353_13460 [Bacteroidia bacterium]|nr:hypothetical protein [Bacteroidia bacterium]